MNMRELGADNMAVKELVDPQNWINLSHIKE